MENEEKYQESNEVSYNGNEVSVLDWVGTILVGAIPCVGIILYLFWAFSVDTKTSKANYCKANLIISATAIVFYFVLLFVLRAIIN